MRIEELFAPLADGRTLHQGWSPQCAEEASESDDEWAVLKTTSIQPGKFQPQHNKRLPHLLAPRPTIEVHVGDILITCAGPRARCGVACLVRSTRPHLLMSGKMYRFRLNPGLADPRYVEAFLQCEQARQAIDAMKTGGSDSGLNLTHERFRGLLIPVAPLPVQQDIVAGIEAQFTQLSAGETAIHLVQSNLKRYRAAVLKAACEGRLVPTEAELAEAEGRTYESGAELLERILEERRKRWIGRGKYSNPSSPDTTTNPTLPGGWSWARLEQLGLIAGGLTKNPKRAKLPDQLPYLRVANVYANELKLDEIEHIGVNDSERARLLLKSGDLLIVEGNGSKAQIGRSAVWDGSIDPCIHQNHLIRVRPTETYMSRWIQYWLQSPQGREHIELVASSTSGLYTLSLRKVGDIPIPVPPRAEQARAVSDIELRLSVVDKLAVAIIGTLRRTAGLRQSLLRRAFNGEYVQ